MDNPGEQQALHQRLDSCAASADGDRPVVVLSANSCWNLLNFRAALLNGLSDAGYRIVAFAPLDEHANALLHRGVELRPIPFARSGMNPIADLALVFRYVRALRDVRPVAYCGFTIKPNVYGGIAARIAGIPAINNVTGLGTMYLGSGPKWRLAAHLYRTAFRRSKVVFFHNQADRDLFIGQKIVRSSQGRVIPGSGVNLDHFRPDCSDSADTALRFLFIGRAIRDKGVCEFVEAARRLRPRMPSARFQLLGNTDPENPSSVRESEFRSWIDEGLIEHLGEHADVRPFIRSATAVVLPSYREGMSRALLEAAAMGKPLVGANVPGSRELIDEGITGVLCEPRDPASLASAMQRIGNMQPGRLRLMGAAARTKVERNFGEQIVVQAYLDVLDEVVGRS